MRDCASSCKRWTGARCCRVKREPVEQGGWNGWPTDPAIEALRQQWFDSPDTEAA